MSTLLLHRHFGDSMKNLAGFAETRSSADRYLSVLPGLRL